MYNIFLMNMFQSKAQLAEPVDYLKVIKIKGEFYFYLTCFSGIKLLVCWALVTLIDRSPFLKFRLKEFS